MNITLDSISTLFLAVALLLIGSILIKKVTWLNRYCIPAPVVGGLLFALLILILKQTGLMNIELDTSLQSIFMLTFLQRLV